MKKGDVIWALLFLVALALFLVPSSREVILSFSNAHHYISGFIKFAILATMGDVMGKRIVSGDYQLSSRVLVTSVVWGIIGCMVTLVFPVFMGGAGQAQEGSLLPFYGVPVAQAIFGSSIMNLTFAPAMNTFHRLADLWIESKYNNEKVSFKGLVNKIDWGTFVTFNWLKVGILFWIPVHSIVFLLPEDIRVAVAAFSSIALGIILSFAAKKGSEPAQITEEEELV
ncbi:hypothetical protein JZO70_21910 [Enterococcus sp. 669A]|uniref:Uncharacterized protein n=1 Tax=Candidatus Enterococcus moelleringii TaxID=2815325 RepID=A0ABS3LGS3_9ENTE|nr:hypothetical protein [Enterococcus sp. 669A]MBO1308842.1 hypothetical protein [Enterococcus sp. 669A]